MSKYIALDRMLSREVIMFEVDVQMLEEIIVKNNECLERALICVDVVSDTMVQQFLQKMYPEFEMSL